MKRISAIAILAGLGIEVLAGAILALAVGISAYWSTSILEPSRFTLEISGISALSTLISGGVTAYYSSCAKLLNTAIYGILSGILIGYGSSWPQYHLSTVIYPLGYPIGTIIFAILGGLVVVRLSGRNSTARLLF